MPQCFAAALGHDLDRQAAIEVGRVGFPLLEVGLFAGDQRIDEAVVLLFCQGAIDVIGAGAAGADLVVARLEPRRRHVDGIPVDDRGDRIEERQRILVGELADGLREWRGGEGPGRDDDIAPVRWRQAVDLTAMDFDQGMVV